MRIRWLWKADSQCAFHALFSFDGASQSLQRDPLLFCQSSYEPCMQGRELTEIFPRNKMPHTNHKTISILQSLRTAQPWKEQPRLLMRDCVCCSQLQWGLVNKSPIKLQWDIHHHHPRSKLEVKSPPNIYQGTGFKTELECDCVIKRLLVKVFYTFFSSCCSSYNPPAARNSTHLIGKAAASFSCKGAACYVFSIVCRTIIFCCSL